MAMKMRDIITIVEQVDPVWSPTDQEIGRFMYGGCWAMAVAIHKQTGLPMVALQEEDTYSRRWGAGQDVIQHVMVALAKNRFLDINGISTSSEIVGRLKDDHDIDASKWRIIATSPEYLRAVARETNDDGDKVLAPLSWYPDASKVAKRLIFAFKAEIEKAKTSLSILTPKPVVAPPVEFPGFRRKYPSIDSELISDNGQWTLRSISPSYWNRSTKASPRDRFVKGNLPTDEAKLAIGLAQADGKYEEHWHERLVAQPQHGGA
jgi:hypothetical protein